MLFWKTGSSSDVLCLKLQSGEQVVSAWLWRRLAGSLWAQITLNTGNPCYQNQFHLGDVPRTHLFSIACFQSHCSKVFM